MSHDEQSSREVSSHTEWQQRELELHVVVSHQRWVLTNRCESTEELGVLLPPKHLFNHEVCVIKY